MKTDVMLAVSGSVDINGNSIIHDIFFTQAQAQAMYEKLEKILMENYK